MSHAILYSWSNPGSRRSGCDTAPPHHDLCVGIGSPTSNRHARRSRMALHVFPDCCLRQGIEAESVALAVDPYRREFLLAKHGDDPMQRNTARAPDKFGVHESIWRDLSRQESSIGKSADWAIIRHYA